MLDKFGPITLSNNVSIPAIGLGTWRMDDSSETVDTIVEAIDTGYRMIDTATMYDNETSVGQAIKDSSVSRDELFVVTKLLPADMGFSSTIAAYQASLDRLGLDYVDLYPIHSPTAASEPYVQSWRAMEHLYRDGRIKAIGVSNFWPAQLDILKERGLMTPHVNQIHLHPYLQQQRTRWYCAEHNIVVQSYSPLMRAGDLLTDPAIAKIAAKHGKTPAQIILRWHIDSGLVPIPKSSNPDRLRENFDIADFFLTEDEISQINRLDRQPR